MVVPESTLGGLSEKHNFDRGKPGWNVKFNDENQRKLIFFVVLGNDFQSGKQNDIQK